ncbi:MAG TPA: succinyldiaminopimelate transaminase [Nocardioidaceae bacterium]|nr:succinyldiaminopimelate transaminase [Nocardioidaceae bacterium]
MSARLPDFPWDALVEYGARARRHRDGIVDLSIGTPVDPTPTVVQDALRAGADAPGYPKTIGTPPLRDAVVSWLSRRVGVDAAPEHVLPTIGSKELVATLPIQLGLGAGDTVVVPELAYPTYEVGARLAGCAVAVSDSTMALGPARVALVWVNSPANPTGRVLGVEHLRKVVEWGRSRGALVVSDECYLEYGWDDAPVSVLHPDVCGGSFDGVLSVHSLSKRSNLAGYRSGFVVGDAEVVAELHEVRRHSGLMMPAPVQAATAAALDDDAHVSEQRARYAARRTQLRTALEGCGFRIDHSEAALYLWATRGESCWQTIDWLAGRGILVAPGSFYGRAGAEHVRIALTASDERVAAACSRLGR